MKRLLTLLLFSNLLLSLLQAQPVHRIRGTVIEKNSHQPLEFINVMVLGLNKGGVTNAEGHFTKMCIRDRFYSVGCRQGLPDFR